MGAKLDLKGRRFGRLLAKREAPAKGYVTFWECLCDCGNRKVTRTTSLTSGKTKSCGCLSREEASKRFTKHGHARKGKHSRTYEAWRAMVSRCRTPSDSAYWRYGGAGIDLCKRWENFSGFLSDMGECPAGRTLDRINNKKGYSKGNCRWATVDEQARNKTSNKLFTFEGKTMCLSDWAQHLGMQQQTLYARLMIYGWPVKRAFTTLVRKHKLTT